MIFSEICSHIETTTGIRISSCRHEMLAVTGSSFAMLADGAFINPDTGKFSEEIIFVIPKLDDELFTIKVLLHELTHATGRKNRLNRFTEIFNGMLYNREEVIAETVAMNLMFHYGILDEITSKSCLSYIQYYGSGFCEILDNQLLFSDNSIQTEIKKAQDYIINWLGNIDIKKIIQAA